MLEQALTYARAHRQENLQSLCEWLCIPSISTLHEHAPDVRRAAQWAAERLQTMGFSTVEVRETPGHPLVYAEWSGVQAPTLLCYGHYDVQPVDPLEEWKHPPFEPYLEGDNLYARGASDDKGQAFAILAALEAYLRTSGRLPLNLKVLFEGEEEITSPNLFAYIEQHAAELAADAILIADQEMFDPEHPVVMYGVRGNLYVELEVRGPQQDLHSGTFGGAVDNPLNVLVRLLSSLQDGETRKVMIPGFYESVEPLSEEERALLAKVPITDPLGLVITGAPALAGEVGYSLSERISVRPTFEIHGIGGGFSGEGAKTVIPAKAVAKLSMRLVPRQNPRTILELLRKHVQSLTPPTVSVDVRVLGMASPVKIDYRRPAVQAAAEAYRRGFGAEAVFFRGGGSLPIVSQMIQCLSPSTQAPIPVVMIGFGLPDDHTHAPNEKIFLPNFYRGIETVIHYLALLSEMRSF